MPLDVVVVGAGIAGLAAAIALRRANHQVTILERRVDKTEAGYAIEIPPNASRILLSFGLDIAKFRGCHQTGIDIFDAEGETIDWKSFEERPSDESSPCMSVHRHDYYNALKDSALDVDGVGPPAELRLGCKVLSYNTAQGSVLLDSGETLVAGLLVAADGKNSMAHKWIIGEERLPQFTGLDNVRFTLPTDVVLQCGGMEDLIRRGVDGKACLYTDWHENMIMHYPCRDGTLQNFGVYHQHDNKSHTSRSKSNREIALERVQNMNPTIQSLVERAEEADMYLWQIVDRDPLPNMQKDRLVVIGDANHPMPPKMGQGAAQAVEDAAVLGVLMEGVDTPDEVPGRLRLWEDVRKPRASAMQLMSRTSPAMTGWVNPEDQKKAQAFFGEGELPLTRTEMVAYAYDHNAVAQARAALERYPARHVES